MSDRTVPDGTTSVRTKASTKMEMRTFQRPSDLPPKIFTIDNVIRLSRPDVEIIRPMMRPPTRNHVVEALNPLIPTCNLMIPNSTGKNIMTIAVNSAGMGLKIHQTRHSANTASMCMPLGSRPRTGGANHTRAMTTMPRMNPVISNGVLNGFFLGRPPGPPPGLPPPGPPGPPLESPSFASLFSTALASSWGFSSVGCSAGLELSLLIFPPSFNLRGCSLVQYAHRAQNRTSRTLPARDHLLATSGFGYARNAKRPGPGLFHWHPQPNPSGTLPGYKHSFITRTS